MVYSIIISTIKGREKALGKLFDSIKKWTTNYEVVIYHDSKQQSIPIADAWNKCAKVAKGEYLVFLNDDMLVTKNWLENQRKLYESGLPQVGSLAFKVFDDEGNIQSRGHSFNGLIPYLPPEEATVVDYSDHPFVRKEIWKRVGGFTAHGQMYYEDASFGLKLQSYGLYNFYNPTAILIHTTLGLRTGTNEDKKQRKYNEEVIQQLSKISFYRQWSNFLNLRKG